MITKSISFQKNYTASTIRPQHATQRAQKQEKRSKWTVQKNKTLNPNEKNYKEKIEILRKKQNENNDETGQDPKTLDFSKFALLTYC